MLPLDAVQTLALAGLVLFLGYALCRAIPVLGRNNLPPPLVERYGAAPGSRLYTYDCGG